jgi:adenosylcobinamide amidohydrolase
MLILNNTTDSLEVVLGGAITVNQLDCTASFREITTTTFDPLMTDASTNGTNPVTLVAAPPASTQRVIDDVSVFNNDTTSAVVTVRYNRNGTFRQLFRATLASGEKLQYTDKNGWVVYATSGAVKQSINQGSNAITGALNLVVLASDVMNNNAVANTLQDVTGLSFPINIGKTYYFRFVFRYDAQVTTTGSRWTVNTVGNTTIAFISYQSQYGVSTTSNTINVLAAQDLPTGANSTSPFLFGNTGWIEGFVTAGANGSLTLRFASEILNSAIIAKAGSLVYWQEVL